MAEAIARSLVQKGSVEGVSPEEVRFFSAGLAAPDGAPASLEVADTLAGMGITSDSSSVRLTPEMVQKADLILGMTRGHVEGIKYLVAADEEAQERVHLLDPEGDVEDPIGQGLHAYKSAADLFDRVIPGRLRELLV